MKLGLALLGSLILSATLTFAADSKSGGNEHMMGGDMKPPTKEERAKMAEHHEKMAACLKSDAPMEDCHKEMMKSCEETHGKGKCPMMGDHKGMHHKGMGHEMMKEHEEKEGK